MQVIEVSDRTAAEVALLGKAWRIADGEVVNRLLEEFRRGGNALTTASPTGAGALQPVAVHAVYRGARVEGQFDPLLSTLEITGGPVPKGKFKTPSAAAIRVISTLHPEVNPNRNGWSFWVITATGKRLQTIRVEGR